MSIGIKVPRKPIPKPLSRRFHLPEIYTTHSMGVKFLSKAVKMGKF
jgi:hypothetical protein